jgi:hypothetical protein
MSSELPIACSLDATELPVRRSEIVNLGRAALIDVRHIRAHAELRFAAANGIRERVAAFAAAEAECCPFLTMRVGDEPGVVVLSVDAPEEAEGVLAELVDVFRGMRQA